MITSACLKIQGRDVSSIMFTFSESDKMNSIPESTVPFKQLTLENSPDKTRESCPLQPTTFCNACNAASVKYHIQMSKKPKILRQHECKHIPITYEVGTSGQVLDYMSFTAHWVSFQKASVTATGNRFWKQLYFASQFNRIAQQPTNYPSWETQEMCALPLQILSLVILSVTGATMLLGWC